MHDSLSQQLNRMEDQLAVLEGLVRRLVDKGEDMSQQLDQLKQRVQGTTDAVASVSTLVSGLAQQIRALKDDPAALEQLAAELDRDNAALGRLVTDNTPAAPGATPAGQVGQARRQP
jgi:chromosome segregation ATPase